MAVGQGYNMSRYNVVCAEVAREIKALLSSSQTPFPNHNLPPKRTQIFTSSVEQRLKKTYQALEQVIQLRTQVLLSKDCNCSHDKMQCQQRVKW